MEWIQSLTRALDYMEENLTNGIGVRDVAQAVYLSEAHFQRLFRLVTGIPVGEYLRSRRLTLAGQALRQGEEKVIDIALRYGYDTPESFSKAFSRFHGVTPSAARQGARLKQFAPITVTMKLQGGFSMSRTIIDRIPLHPLQYPQQGQNYVFNGCMKFLMECAGEREEGYDYWFFSAVSGDSYVQVVNTNRGKWSTCFSQAKFDRELIRRVFDSIGYGYSYLGPEDWRRDREAARARLMAEIDRGMPVLGKGFCPEGREKDLPTSEVSCVVGYEGEGERFLRLSEESTELVPFTLEDDLPYVFVFLGEKREAPTLAEAYRAALKRMPELMETPPEEDGKVYFGASAFEKWADMLENGFYHMSRREYEADHAIANWRYYCVYVCMIATNIFSKETAIHRAIRQNPDLAPLAQPLDREYETLNQLMGELEAAGGGFSVCYESLQSREKCGEFAAILRRFSPVWRRICQIVREGKL